MYKLSNTIIRDKYPSLLYTNSYSFFDSIIKQIEDIYCIDINHSHPNKYGLVCMNNASPDSSEYFVDQCSKYQSVGLYLHHMITDVFTNANTEQTITTLKSIPFYRSITFCTDIKNNDNTNYNIVYGLPKHTKDILNKNRKDVLILANPIISETSINLQKSIQAAGTNCDISDNIASLDIEETYDMLSDYKLIIDNYSYINLIAAAYCGAKVMTASTNMINEAFISRLHNDSSSYVKNLLNNFSVDTGVVSYLENKYNYDNFIKSFKTILNNINQELFYI